MNVLAYMAAQRSGGRRDNSGTGGHCPQPLRL